MHTNGRRKYIKSMVEYAELEDHLEEIQDNMMKNKHFIKFGEFCYTDKSLDMDTYKINYLLNNGYSLEQIKQILKNDKFGEDLDCHYFYIHSKKFNTYDKVKEFLEK